MPNSNATATATATATAAPAKQAGDDPKVYSLNIQNALLYAKDYDSSNKKYETVTMHNEAGINVNKIQSSGDSPVKITDLKDSSPAKIKQIEDAQILHEARAARAQITAEAKILNMTNKVSSMNLEQIILKKTGDLNTWKDCSSWSEKNIITIYEELVEINRLKEEPSIPQNNDIIVTPNEELTSTEKTKEFKKEFTDYKYGKITSISEADGKTTYLLKYNTPEEVLKAYIFYRLGVGPHELKPINPKALIVYLNKDKTIQQLHDLLMHFHFNVRFLVNKVLDLIGRGDTDSTLTHSTLKLIHLLARETDPGEELEAHEDINDELQKLKSNEEAEIKSANPPKSNCAYATGVCLTPFYLAARAASRAVGRKGGRRTIKGRKMVRKTRKGRKGKKRNLLRKTRKGRKGKKRNLLRKTKRQR